MDRDCSLSGQAVPLPNCSHGGEKKNNFQSKCLFQFVSIICHLPALHFSEEPGPVSVMMNLSPFRCWGCCEVLLNSLFQAEQALGPQLLLTGRMLQHPDSCFDSLLNTA